MKQITITKEVTDIVYQSIDGVNFESPEQCEKYEKSALGVINANFNKLVLGEYDAWDLMGGHDDNTVVAVKMEYQRDVDTVKQRYLYDNTYLLGNSDNQKAAQKKTFDIIDAAYENKDILLIGVNTEDNMYMIGPVSKYIDNLKNIGKEESTQ